MVDETKMTIRFEGRETAPFTLADLQEATRALQKRAKTPSAPEFKAVSDHTYNVSAEQLRQFIERYEQLESEKKDTSDRMKEVMGEAKATGYNTKVMRKIIALRKRKPDDIAEEESVLEIYKQALGMS